MRQGEFNMLQHEKLLWESGFTAIAGVDEVGRGCLFGDVVAAAVILPKSLVIEGINDSKKLTERKREQLYDEIIDSCISWSVARINASEIDRINIKQASRLAMKIAAESLDPAPDYVLIDAEKLDISLPQQSLIKGDAVSQTIAAASIIAKVTRDRLCVDEWEEKFPGYGIAVHKGYATKHHRDQLLLRGPSSEHRASFLKKILGDSNI